MKQYTVTAINLETGTTVHITGEWENDDEMRQTLEGDGYIVTWYTKG